MTGSHGLSYFTFKGVRVLVLPKIWKTNFSFFFFYFYCNWLFITKHFFYQRKNGNSNFFLVILPPSCNLERSIFDMPVVFVPVLKQNKKLSKLHVKWCDRIFIVFVKKNVEFTVPGSRGFFIWWGLFGKKGKFVLFYDIIFYFFFFFYLETI